MISIKNISKSFGNKCILKAVNLTILDRERIVFVGKNGSGKTTLFKIIAGLIEPDKGKVEKSKNLKIDYFPQEISEVDQEQTVEEFLANGLLIEKNEVRGKIGLIFEKLQFPLKKLKEKIRNLSGGEKNKILLMLIFKSSADILLLDEPTNNLDLRGLVLLEKFINLSKKGFLIVSHDRKFLNQFADSIVEMDDKNHSIKIYRNRNYIEYLEERKRKEQQLQEEYNEYVHEKKRLTNTIHTRKQEAQSMQKGPKKRRDKDKYVVSFKKDRSKRIASQASSVEKRLEQMKKIERPRKPLALNLMFNLVERSGDVVFRLKDAKVNYNDFSLASINLEINYRDRIVILGPNGEGKSTLLKLFLGENKPEIGSSFIGSNVKIGYLPQEVNFNYEENIIDYFLKKTEINKENARRILVRFGFFENEIYSRIDKISPGQRSRIILAILMACPINCLVLDEPSNHLDPEAIDRLEIAMRDFNGTIIMVSHDRYLIDKVNINKTFLLDKGKITTLKDYHEYEDMIFL